MHASWRDRMSRTCVQSRHHAAFSAAYGRMRWNFCHVGGILCSAKGRGRSARPKKQSIPVAVGGVTGVRLAQVNVCCPGTEVLVMNERQFSGGNIRKLWPTETEKFRDHLLRLDKMSRRLRFAHGVSDS